MVNFVIGMFFGAVIGIFVVSWITAGRDEEEPKEPVHEVIDDEETRERRARDEKMKELNRQFTRMMEYTGKKEQQKA